MPAPSKRPSTQQSQKNKITLTEGQKKEIKEAFDIFDLEGTGHIETKELQVAMKAIGYETTKDEVKHLIRKYDKSQAGTVDFSDFLQIVGEKLNERGTDDELERAFRLFDGADGDGKITLDKLKMVAQELGENVTDDELKEMIEEADQHGDGYVTQDDFFKMLRKTSLYSSN